MLGELFPPSVYFTRRLLFSSQVKNLAFVVQSSQLVCVCVCVLRAHTRVCFKGAHVLALVLMLSDFCFSA